MDFFPHEIIREGQDDFIADVKSALEQGKILLVQAPTGIGKTASVLSATLKYALEENKKVFFLTNRHTQHNIAIETLQLIKQKTNALFSCVDLIGKRWMCNQEVSRLFGSDFNEFCKNVVEKGECEFYNKVRPKSGLSVEAQAIIKQLEKQILHNEELIDTGAQEKMCSYELALGLAKKATVLIGDYNYLFNPYVQNTLFNKMEITFDDVIVIVDEGHNLPSRVVDMMSNSISTFMLKNAISEARKYHYLGVINWLEEIEKIMSSFASTGEEQIKIDQNDFSRAIKQIINYDTLIEELESAAQEIRKKQRKSYLGGIATFLESWQGQDEGFVRYIEKRNTKYGEQITLNYSCLDPALVTRDIFNQIYGGVVMSATLTPTFMYKDILGINKAVEKKYPSPFPPENKISLIVPETSTKYTTRNEKMYQQIADRCSQLLSLIPGNVAFFFPSYYLRDQVGEFIKSSKKVLWEKTNMSREEKSELLADFYQERIKGGVLLGVIGANFAEGVDFPGDLLQGVVVVGLPLAKPDLLTREIINYYDLKYAKGWDYGYTYPAISKCIQSAGRCIRSETDKGAVIFLDERFAWPKYHNCLPREGLIVSKNYPKLLTDFFA